MFGHGIDMSTMLTLSVGLAKLSTSLTCRKEKQYAEAQFYHDYGRGCRRTVITIG